MSAMRIFMRRAASIMRVLEQSTAHECLVPERVWRYAVFGKQMGECDRRIEVDHRSSRSPSSSPMSRSNVTTGARGGGPSRTTSGAANHPRRMASAGGDSAVEKRQTNSTAKVAKDAKGRRAGLTLVQY